MRAGSEDTPEDQQNEMSAGIDFAIPGMAGNASSSSSSGQGAPIEDLDLIMQTIESEMQDTARSLPIPQPTPSTSAEPKTEDKEANEPPAPPAVVAPPPLVYIYHHQNKTYLVICKVT